MSNKFIEAFFENDEEALGSIDLLFLENEKLFYNFKLIDGLRGMRFEVEETLCHENENLTVVSFVFSFDEDNDSKVDVKATYKDLSLEAHGDKDEHGDYVFKLV